MPTVKSRLLLLGVVVSMSVSCSTANPLAGRYATDTVSYRPPTAQTTAAADCLAENIYTGLTGLGTGDPALTPAAPDPGYPPGDFEAVAVVRCERGIDDDGYLTVDTVRYNGDMTDVRAAFSAESRRYPDNVVPSCVYSMESPVGLWFLDANAHAFRPAWPTSPCGLQNDPLDALAGLREVSRSSHLTGYNDRFSTECQSRSYAPRFETTTPDDVSAARERKRSTDVTVVPSLVLPIDDVDALQLCVYEVPIDEAPENGGDPPVGSKLSLNRAESAAIVRSIVEAPIAPACGEPSARVAMAQLRRPDGSGVSTVSFELDGCHRARTSVGYYVTTPPDVLAAVDPR